jgi:hypothetical protein
MISIPGHNPYPQTGEEVDTKENFQGNPVVEIEHPYTQEYQR